MIDLGGIRLRAFEAEDVDALYQLRNSESVLKGLGGFSTGYSRRSLAEWIETHRHHVDEVLWAIALKDSDRCIGHVGLYGIDHRVRKAEFGITIHESQWEKGFGGQATSAVLEFGFSQLNLNKVSLTVLANNGRAIKLYEHMGFRQDGVLREEQFRDGRYVDMLLMSILRCERQIDDQ
jgi:[ribosomal protein S5]-alanine N-acetyltransferase